MKKILFVSHDASRTGAPIILLTLLRWLKKNTDIEITILLMGDGPLEPDFVGLGDTYHWSPTKSSPYIVVRGVSKVSSKVFKKSFHASFPIQLNKKKFDLVFLNTVASLTVAPILKKKFHCPVIAHIHENEYSIDAFYSDYLNTINKQNINSYIAVSQSTKRNLIENHGIVEAKIELIYEFVDVDKIKKPTEAKGAIKQQMHIDSSFVVGGSGLTNWRKGIDLFIATAAYIVKNYFHEDIKFIWVGALDPFFKLQLNYEIEKLGLVDKLIFTGVQANPTNFFQIFDVFLLTSREDPFPLVCLEAATLSKPIICFEQSGGMTEFVAEGRGVAIPYGDIRQLAESIISLKRDEIKRNQLGEKANNNVNQYDVNQIAPQILNVIENAKSIRYST